MAAIGIENYREVLSARDSYRLRVYRAESLFWSWKPQDKGISLDEARKIVSDIWRMPERLLPQVTVRRPNPFIHVRRNAHRASAFVHENRIAFGPCSLRPWVVLHEAAHLIAPMHSHHGALWVGTYLRLVELVFGFELREGLAAEFRSQRVPMSHLVMGGGQ